METKSFKTAVSWYIKLVTGVILAVCFQNCSGFNTTAIPSKVGGELTTEFYSKTCKIQKPTLRHLTQNEYLNITSALIGPTSLTAEDLPKDVANGIGFIKSADSQNIYDADIDAYYNAAEKAVDFAFESNLPSEFENCIGNDGILIDACFTEGIAGFLSRAYRRPASPEEIADGQKLVAGEATYDKVALKTFVISTLMSPHFIFVEDFSNTVDSENKDLLIRYGLVSRLALTLWSSLPDSELLSLAQSGEISNRATLDAQVDRMLNDKQSTRFIMDFTAEWLGLANIENRSQELESFKKFMPEMSVAHLEDMRTETQLFVKHIFDSDLSITELLEADYSFVNSRLADIYNMTGVNSTTDFAKVRLPAGERKGLLTQASLLTESNIEAETTSVVIRGLTLVEKILCRRPPDPDAALLSAFVEEQAAQGLVTAVSQVESRLGNPKCAGCHSNMDPVGLGLENYNPIGQFRTKYEFTDEPVIASQTIYGKPFNNAVQLSNIVSENVDFGKCIAEHVTSFFHEQALHSESRCVANSMSKEIDIKGMTLKQIVKNIVLRSEYAKMGEVE